MTSPPEPDTQTELAKERNRIAADRTLLAWIRTSIILIGVGFGISRIVAIIYRNVGGRASPRGLSTALGLAFIGLGTFAVTAAIIDYQGELRRLHQPEYYYTSRLAVGRVVAAILLVIAIGAWVAIWMSMIR